MKTIEIEEALFRFFDITRNYVVPNVTNQSFLVGFEADILSVSHSGYATCVEIKVSKSDLKNDLKKKHIKGINGVNHDFYYNRLKHFYYAVPDYLVDDALKQIPDFCGLLEVKKMNSYNTIKCIRTAKKIGNYKWSEKQISELTRLGTMRIKNLISKLAIQTTKHIR